MIDKTRIKRRARRGAITTLRVMGARHSRSKDPLDRKQAVFYLTPAAKMGCAKAQFNLGSLYEKGNGVWKNKCYAYAYMWYYLAAAKGHNEAKIRLDKLANKMVCTQITEAERRAKKYRKPCYEYCKKRGIA